MCSRKLSLILLLCWIGLTTNAQQYSQKYTQLQTELASGWNTWSYESMLNHVLLPDGLSIKINFRQSFIGVPRDPKFLLDKANPDTTRNVKPIAHSYDGSYTALLIDGWRGNQIMVQSAAHGRDVVILITPVKNGEGYFVDLESGILWNGSGQVSVVNGKITAKLSNDVVQINCTALSVESYYDYLSPYLTFRGGEPIGFYSGDKERPLSEVVQIIKEAQKKYDAEANAYGTFAEAYKGIQSVISWNTLYDPKNKRVISPVTRGWNEAWHGYVLFEWDTYFASMLFAINNKELAYSNAIAVTKGQKNMGQVGFIQWPHGQPSTQSQPPVGAMACWTIYDKYQEKWFLEEVYQELFTWNRWWETNRNNQGYLTWGAGWIGAEKAHIILESGLDNSPMYEDIKVQQVGGNSLMNLADVGLNSLYVSDCQYLAKIAHILGKAADEKELNKRSKKFTMQIAKLWDQKSGIYLNKYVDTQISSPRLTPTLFYPMLANVPSKNQAQRMLNEHYNNPSEFAGQYGVPSCARNDKSYDNDYWRGAIWGPMNYLVYIGLREYDKKAASDLANQSYDLFLKAWKENSCVYENINSKMGVDPQYNKANSDPYYHWGAMMALMKFMEEGIYNQPKTSGDENNQ